MLEEEKEVTASAESVKAEGQESAAQVGLRAKRLGVTSEHLHLSSENILSFLLDYAQNTHQLLSLYLLSLLLPFCFFYLVNYIFYSYVATLTKELWCL